ncbi:chondroitin sulfate synthase 1-like [Branchiostoma lanceolatum]|uniref:chondroitin sulfate synthase 1-like n=1 Tax=Branchiostoma lanceolatum TaxID=7740 RepID=UPI003451EE31
MQRRGPDGSFWGARKRPSGRVGRRLLTLGVAFIVTVCLQFAFSRTFSTGDQHSVLKPYNSSELHRLRATEVKVRRPLYVAVQTTNRHLRTYVSAIQNTWASKTDDAHMEFFVDVSGKTSSEAPRYPIVGLNGTDETQILTYLCERRWFDFDWFALARDQTYVKTDEVVTFLRQRDKREEIIVGHMGEVLMGEAGWERCADSDVEDMAFSAVLDTSVTLFSAPAFKEICSTLAMCEKQSPERMERQSACLANYIVQVCGTKTTKYSRLFYEAQVEPTYSGQSSVTSGPFDPDFLWRNTHVTSALTLYPVKDAKTTYQLYHYFHGADYSIRRSS